MQTYSKHVKKQFEKHIIQQLQINRYHAMVIARAKRYITTLNLLLVVVQCIYT